MIRQSERLMFEMLLLTLDELWAVHDYVRNHQDQGCEWEKDFMARVMEALQASTSTANRQAVILVYERELWQIDRQVPSALMIGTQPVGRNLLLKVGRLLVKYQAVKEMEGVVS